MKKANTSFPTPKVNKVLVHRVRDCQEDLKYLDALAKKAPEYMRKAILDLREQVQMGSVMGILKPGDELYAIL